MSITVWHSIILLLGITLAAFVLNLPFGYLRAGAKKLSVKWFLYIHLPIPFIFVLRNLAGFSVRYIPIIAVGAILGQLIGGKFNNQPKTVNEGR